MKWPDVSRRRARSKCCEHRRLLRFGLDARFSCELETLCLLIERLAQRDIALLLLRPVAAAGDGAVDHQIVAVDETRLMASEKHRSLRDIVRQTGARNWLRGLVDLAHHLRCLLRRLDREA